MWSDHDVVMGTIKRMHGCDSTHVETVHILEKHDDGRTLWDGNVEVFDLLNFPKATRCYVWTGIREGHWVVVLHSDKVDSPRKAVISRLVLGSKRHD
jgi:hypothetical protein